MRNILKLLIILLLFTSGFLVFYTLRQERVSRIKDRCEIFPREQFRLITKTLPQAHCQGDFLNKYKLINTLNPI